MDYSFSWLIAMALLALILSAPSSKHSSGLRRLGGDPGLFNLRIWLARIQFLWAGAKLVDQSYQKVSEKAPMA
jgi:hypothetical protein